MRQAFPGKVTVRKIATQRQRGEGSYSVPPVFKGVKTHSAQSRQMLPGKVVSVLGMFVDVWCFQQLKLEFLDIGTMG